LLRQSALLCKLGDKVCRGVVFDIEGHWSI
jgi:hypothetical protein